MSTATSERQGPGTTRRDFLKRVGTAAAAATFVAVAGFETDALAQVGANGAADDSTQAFRVDHPEGIAVRFTSGRKFDVVVADAQGTVVEQHRSITTSALMRIRSDYFTVTPIIPGT